MKHSKIIAIVLSTALAWAGFTTTVSAAVVTTTDALAMGQSSQLLAVQAGMARSEVQQALISLGVDPLEAQMRVAALGEQELAELQGQLDDLPAGGILAEYLRALVGYGVARGLTRGRNLW